MWWRQLDLIVAHTTTSKPVLCSVNETAMSGVSYPNSSMLLTSGGDHDGSEHGHCITLASAKDLESRYFGASFHVFFPKKLNFMFHSASILRVVFSREQKVFRNDKKIIIII